MPAEEARIIGILLKAKAVEDLPDFVIPMLRTTTQAVQGAFEEAVLVLLRIRVPDRRFDDGEFVRRKDTLAKGVLAVALF